MKRILFGLIFLLASCIDQNEQSTLLEESSFIEAIGDIALKINFYRFFDYSSNTVLINDEKFSHIYRKPSVFFDYAVNAIQNPNLNLDEKKIVVYAMQCLERVQYIELFNEIYKEVLKENSNVEVLYEAIYPGVDIGKGVVNYFYLNDVKDVLDDIYSSDFADEKIRNKISHIYTGKYRKYIQHLESTVEQDSLLSCMHKRGRNTIVEMELIASLKTLVFGLL